MAIVPSENGTKSKYKFPKEVPTKADWKRWQLFWTNYTTIGRKLPVELGRWINSTHRTWRWFYINETDDLQRLDKNKLHHYQRRAGRTRGTTEYDMTWTEDYTGQQLGTPTSVTASFSEASVSKLSRDPISHKALSNQLTSGSFLHPGEGNGCGKALMTTSQKNMTWRGQ